MVEMFQTKIWDDLLDAYKTTLVGSNSYRAIPYDIQTKASFVADKVDGKTIGWHANAKLFTTGQYPPMLNDSCFYGAIVQAENDRIFGWTVGEKPVFEEVDNDSVDLLDTHVVIYDNAVSVNGDPCPNVYKNKKVYKELNLPIMLKAANADTFPIEYTVHVDLAIPTDAIGGQIDMEHSFTTPEKETLVPFAKIIMPAIIFVKPDCVSSPPTPEVTCPTGVGALM